MIAAFDIADVNKAASAFNPEKLLWLNQQHLMRSDLSEVVPYLKPHLARIGINCDDEILLTQIVIAQRERVKTLKEMAENSRYFFGDSVQLDEKAAAKHLTSDAKELLQEFTAPVLHEALKAFAEKRQLGLGKIAQPLRVAVTGSTISPPIDMTLEMLGRDRVMSRLSVAVTAC
jgi:glutamyl-tRNA synthetase